MMARLIMVRSRAAEPVSFAIFESGCISSPCRSIAASIAEFMSSSASTEKRVAMRMARCVVSCVMKKMVGKAKREAMTSHLNEGSFFQAALIPS